MLLVLILLVFIYVGLEFWVYFFWGCIFKVIWEDEEIFWVLGKNVFWYKLQVFMGGGAIVGLVGVLFVW